MLIWQIQSLYSFNIRSLMLASFKKTFHKTCYGLALIRTHLLRCIAYTCICLLLLVLSRNYQPVLPTDERQWHDATTFFFEGTNYLPPLCMSQWSKIRFAGLGNNATFLLRNDLLLLDEKQHMNVNDVMGQSQPPDDLVMV